MGVEAIDLSVCGPQVSAQMAHAQPPVEPGWEATLELAFEARVARSVLARRRHHGPLAIQRAFYPERDGTCHAYILHPPGGIVGGDRLNVDVEAGAGSRVLVTTPAATKFYRSAGSRAEQTHRFRIGTEACVEWLPQETIVFDGAELSTHIRVDLAEHASFLGWEVLCLGRPWSDERFTRGRVEQRFEVWRDGEPLVLERARYQGAGAELAASWGLGGKAVVGSLICVPDARAGGLSAAPIDGVRSTLTAVAGAELACSELANALVCRYLGDSVERALQAFRAAWGVLRPFYAGKAPVPPRIWAT
jgi:urease accessory protein